MSLFLDRGRSMMHVIATAIWRSQKSVTALGASPKKRATVWGRIRYQSGPVSYRTVAFATYNALS